MQEKNRQDPTNQVVPPSKDSESIDVIKRASKGDSSVLPQVNKLLDVTGPILDLPAFTRRQIITSMFGENLFAAEDLARQCEDMRTQLAAEGSSPTELLLIDRIIVCWLALHQYELSYIYQTEELDIPWSDFQQRRLDRATHRYLAAVKSLADVRRLRIPLIQLNIAEKQLNLAANGTQAQLQTENEVAGFV